MRQKPHRVSAFSLVEILVVMSIAVTLIALASFGISKLLASAQITQAGQMVMDTISLARQEAVRSNREVQLVFFKLPDGAGTHWRAVQLWSVEETVDGPVVKVISKLQNLPNGVIISEDSKLSPLLTADPTIMGSRDAGDYKNAAYKGFRIRPGGSLDKAVTPDTNFITLQRVTETGPKPVNYFTVQINPITGGLRSYRP